MERITLENTAFEGRNNAYVLEAGERIVLLDTAIASSDSRSQLREGIDALGYDVTDLEAIVLTHWHPDHVGLAGELQAESEATIYAHERDAPLIERAPDAIANLAERQEHAFTQWGMPAEERETLLSFLRSHSGTGEHSPDVTTLQGGDTIDVGEWRLETIHTPGHTDGHCIFETVEGAEAFVGDAILPVYTPNVGGADVRVERPLEKYLSTLRRIVERDYERVWPGHRDPIETPTDRAVTIYGHHRERTENVLAVLADHGPADAWTVSAHLFGDLEGIHVMHGPGEAYAHLDHLAHAGVLENDEGTYRLREAAVDLDDVIEPIQ